MIRRLTETDENSLLGRLLRLPLRLVPDGRIMTVRSGINKGARWKANSSLHSCWLGTYEPEKQELVASLVRPGMTVWDVGANAGFYTVAFSRLVGATGHVFAFEPFAENADNLLGHVQLNALENVVLVQAAMGDTDGLAGFQTAELNSMGRTSRMDEPYLVPSVTSDSFLQRRPDARPDLLKIDVEGAESAVLAGARHLLTTHAPDLLLALHGEEEVSACVSFLHALDYEIWYLDGSRADALPLSSDEVYARRTSTSAAHQDQAGTAS